MPKKVNINTLTFNSYLDLIVSTMTATRNQDKKYALSNVKKIILKTLWNEGDEFPKNWVSSERLLDLTKQKYFDRRIRELRDQVGCDIKTGSYKGQPAYRLISPKLNQAFESNIFVC